MKICDGKGMAEEITAADEFTHKSGDLCAQKTDDLHTHKSGDLCVQKTDDLHTQKSDDLNTGKHMRRKHYAGKYPRHFDEKYKEHHPEKYEETVKHVIAKGSTPAGMHISICVNEIMDVLNISPGENGLDCTLGYGGHSGHMLKALDGKGHLTGLDIDPIESAKTEERIRKAGYGEDIFSLRNINFADIDKVAAEFGKFDFILADLGVSSMQIDDPERGFSYKLEGPLDLRLDPTSGISAAHMLAGMSEEEIKAMLVENSDEPYAAEISRVIARTLKRHRPIETTSQLRRLIEEALTFLPAPERGEMIKKSCQRTFQALRIDVNREFEALEQLLIKLPDVINPGGRAAILTFHSGEDRLVKQYFRMHFREGSYSEIAKDVIRPSAEECRANGRARSAKLRYAIRA